ncbi:site-specific integrase [Candidatus Bathyarchaeota archaeon]|nr:site-specific integrase [Candidatus Bathyarchaeota archaeon]
MDKALNEWLVRQKGRYKQKCEMSFSKFTSFLKEKHGMDLNGDGVLSKRMEDRKSDDPSVRYFFDNAIYPFTTWLEEHGNSHNTAVVQSGMVRSFFKYYRMRIEVQDKIGFNETKKRYHAYTRDELYKMVEVGDLEAKSLIMLGTQLGIRVNDFVAMKKNTIIEAYQNSNGEFPLEFEIETEKEKVISIGHCTKEVYEVLQNYWAYLKEKGIESEFIFPFNGSHIIDQRANDILKTCWLKAFPDRKTQKIRFHELRSYKMSALTNVGANQWAIMKMVGKKVSSDISVYLAGINLKEVFMKAEQALSLTQVTNNNHVAIDELRNENKDLKTQLKAMTERLNGFEANLEEFKQFQSELKFFKEGGWEIAYTGPELKEEMIETLKELALKRQNKEKLVE